MPVVGARKPMRSSSALAMKLGFMPSARQPPSSSGLSRRGNGFVIVLTSSVVAAFPFASGRHGCHALPAFPFGSQCPSLANAFRNAHQAGWKIEDRQHVDRSQDVLPPGNQRAEIFPQADDDAGADDAAFQRPPTPENRH